MPNTSKMITKEIVWSKYESGITKFLKGKKKNIFMQGNNGVFFPDEAPDKRFNLYDGDCNFVVTETDFVRIAKIPGVEGITPMTPYKLRIAVAKLFNADQVLLAISKAINPFKDVHNEIIGVFKVLAEKKFADFVIYEDFNRMIHITDQKTRDTITDGFLILDSQMKPSGV